MAPHGPHSSLGSLECSLPTPSTPVWCHLKARNLFQTQLSPQPALGLLGSVPACLGFGIWVSGAMPGLGKEGKGLCLLGFCRCPWLYCPLLPICTQERRARCTQYRASPQNPPTSRHQAQALRRDPNSGKISKSIPRPVLLLDIGETHIYIALLLIALKSVFWCKNIKKCIMYDLVSHLIYLDNFSEEKTNKTSLGKDIPPLLPPVLELFSVPPLLSSGEGRGGAPTPHPGAGSGGRRGCSSSGAHAPPRDVKLINFIMVVSSLMFFFAMSRL